MTSPISSLPTTPFSPHLASLGRIHLCQMWNIRLSVALRTFSPISFICWWHENDAFPLHSLHCYFWHLCYWLAQRWAVLFGTDDETQKLITIKTDIISTFWPHHTWPSFPLNAASVVPPAYWKQRLVHTQEAPVLVGRETRGIRIPEHTHTHTQIGACKWSVSSLGLSALLFVGSWMTMNA